MDIETQKFIEQLKSKNEIVEVVSAYCNLESKGSSYWACCPLPGHMEKTPSFSVNPEGQFFKCFGCGRGGDVIKFIMEMESLEYWDAVKFLADRVGLEVPSNKSEYDDKKNQEFKKLKERLFAILKETAHFYVNNLSLPEAKEHRDYLEKRGFDKKLQRKFGIGASLDYNSLPKHLLSKGFTYDEMVKAGVVSYVEETKSYADFEARRLIIPIISRDGNVIAFGGRVIWQTDFAKYKNTSETIIFNKRKVLYNLNTIKKIKSKSSNVLAGGKLDYVIMVEGYMDTIALASMGIDNVVASMGTSLTQEQAKMLANYTNKVVISYDGDGAGQNATIRGMEILRDAGLTVKVISLPDNMDPDEFVKAKGVEAYLELVDDSEMLVDYKLNVLKKKFDLSTTEGKRKYIAGAIKIIREIKTNFEQEELLKKLSKSTGIAYEYLRRDLENLPQNGVAQTAKPKERSVFSLEEKAERFVLWAVLDKNSTFAKAYDLEKIEFSNEYRQMVADYVLDKADNNEEVFKNLLSNVVGEGGLEELGLILSSGEKVYESATKKYYFDCLTNLELLAIERDIDQLNRLIASQSEISEQLRLAKMVNDKQLKAVNLRKKLTSKI